jgi:hypothetical protein
VLAFGLFSIPAPTLALTQRREGIKLGIIPKTASIKPKSWVFADFVPKMEQSPLLPTAML